MEKTLNEIETAVPLCPVFGECGGCAFQNIPYERELEIKEAELKALLQQKIRLEESVFSPIVRSPQEYYYRSRLDLTLRRLKDGEFAFGFQVHSKHQTIPLEACAIARREISDFLPALKKLAIEKVTEATREPGSKKYRVANLVARSGDEKRVLWGGVGRRSLKIEEADYFWTEINGRRIYYSLDTFFQANLFILPELMRVIGSLAGFDQSVTFYDLYAGVGLFGIYFADQVGRVVMMEENTDSTRVMDYNVRHHGLTAAECVTAKVETALGEKLASNQEGRRIAMIDPPRRGLSPEVLNALSAEKSLEKLFYLSCSPESLARDLAGFEKAGWKIEKIVPFDFFPRTPHLETLALLTPEAV